MGISQQRLDRAARQCARALDAARETVTYTHRTVPGAAGTAYSVEMLIDDYRLTGLVPDTILPTDRRGRIRRALVSWTPTHYDTVARADGSTWLVIHPSGGSGQMFWHFQLREQ